MMHVKRVGDELYVYWNGDLLYKKWLNQDRSLLFDKYGPPISNKDRDELQTNSGHTGSTSE